MAYFPIDQSLTTWNFLLSTWMKLNWFFKMFWSRRIKSKELSSGQHCSPLVGDALLHFAGAAAHPPDVDPMDRQPSFCCPPDPLRSRGVSSRQSRTRSGVAHSCSPIGLSSPSESQRTSTIFSRNERNDEKYNQRRWRRRSKRRWRRRKKKEKKKIWVFDGIDDSSAPESFREPTKPTVTIHPAGHHLLLLVGSPQENPISSHVTYVVQ